MRNETQHNSIIWASQFIYSLTEADYSFAAVAARAGAVGGTLVVGVVLGNLFKFAALGLHDHKAVAVPLLGAVGLVSAVAVVAGGRHGCSWKSSQSEASGS